MQFRHIRCAGSHWVSNPNDRYIGKSLEVYGEWSFGEVALLMRHAAPDSIIVEVGANIGAHTVPLARHVKDGRVISFEPQRLCFQMLCANVINNDCTNVEAVHAAVGRESGKAEIPDIDPATFQNFGGVSAKVVDAARAPGRDVVAMITLDDVLAARTGISAIKCDAEGSEVDVLLGATATIDRERPFLYLEDDRTEFSENLFATVTDMGYDVWWHAVPLFREDNFAKTRENIFARVHSFALACTHRDSGVTLDPLPRIRTLKDHPLLKAKAAEAG